MKKYFLEFIADGAFGEVFKICLKERKNEGDDEKKKEYVNFYPIIDKNFSILKKEKKLALKVMKQRDKNFAKKEYKFLKELKGCKNVVDVVDFKKYNNKYLILMKYYPFSLYDTLEYIVTMKQKMAIFYNILCAVQECHKKNIIHLDLKTENFLVELNSDEKIVKVLLCDFGFSEYSYSKTKNIEKEEYYIGTFSYRPIELFYKTLRYDKEVDIWSVGIILIDLFSEGVFLYTLNEKKFKEIEKYTFHSQHDFFYKHTDKNDVKEKEFDSIIMWINLFYLYEKRKAKTYKELQHYIKNYEKKFKKQITYSNILIEEDLFQKINYPYLEVMKNNMEKNMYEDMMKIVYFILKLNPCERPTIEQIIQYLKDNFEIPTR